MNFKRHCTFPAGMTALAALFVLLAGCATPMPYTETRDENYLYLNPFRYKPDSPENHWDHALSLRDRGRARRAAKELETLIRRWPDSREAISAQRALADLYAEQGKSKKAFDAYDDLITQYYTDIQNYDEVLERQLRLAEKEMNRRRMRWLFGGYRAPERAVPLFEAILKNAPQWERAPEIQFRIGEAYRKNDDREMAVVAYSTVEYRYPDSPYAEKAALARIEVLHELVEKIPYSVDIREEARLAARIFPELYPRSEHLEQVRSIAQDLENRSARYTHEIAKFYERVPRPAQKDAAAIYHEKTVSEFAGTEYADRSARRLSVLLQPEESAPAEPESPPARPAITEAAPLPARVTEDKEAVEVTADRIEYAGDILIAEGNAAVQQEGASLQADRLTVNPDTGEITAAGNIVMIRDGGRWEGQELVYNYKTREGTFEESFMYFEPAYITARKTERISDSEFVMYDAMITTCDPENPPVYAKVKEMRVLDKQGPEGVFIQAKHATFYVGPVPVFYTPVWQRHLGHRVFTAKMGASGRLGAFIQGSANLRLTEWLRSSTHLDLYSRRGIGMGQDFGWLTPGGQGGIKTYYISDQSPDRKNYTASERALLSSDRYRVSAEHREQIDEETYFMTRLNWLSDPGVIEQFFREEFRYQANPENYAVLQRSAETYALGVRADRRMNNFYTTVDRVPMLTYDRYRARLGTTPLYLESENSFGYFEQLHARMPGQPRPPDYRSARLDSYNQIFLPLRYNDWLNIIPRAGYRATWYSKTDTPGSDADLRNIFETGLLTSFKAHKTITEKSGFFGDGLRHIAEPYADYLYRADPDLRPNQLFQFDRVDELEAQNDIRFGMRNFLQTKRGPKRLANVLDSDVYTSYRFDPQRAQHEMGPVVADAEMSLTDNLFIQADAEYDRHTTGLTPANARLRWVTEDRSIYSLGYRYRDDDIAKRSLLTASALLFPNAKWSYEFLVRYDGRNGAGWEDRMITIRREFDCIGVGTGFNLDKDDEVHFWFQMWLTAFSNPFAGMMH